jgi:hypothetical protein
MELKDISTEALLAELEKREVKQTDGVLIVGTIGVDIDQPFVESFKKVESEKDLEFLWNASLRSRFNPQRRYRMFYFKSTDFDLLEEHYKSDNISFAKWVNETPSIKFKNI